MWRPHCSSAAISSPAKLATKLAVAEATAAASAVLALFSCYAVATYSLAGQGQAWPWLATAKSQCGPSLPPSTASPLARALHFPLCPVPVRWKKEDQRVNRNSFMGPVVNLVTQMNSAKNDMFV